MRWNGADWRSSARGGGGPGDDRGTVEFRAHWRMRATGEAGALHEVSRFLRVRGRWFYLDGDVEEDAAPR